MTINVTQMKVMCIMFQTTSYVCSVAFCIESFMLQVTICSGTSVLSEQAMTVVIYIHVIMSAYIAYSGSSLTGMNFECSAILLK